jgi:hypothetical protein
MINNIFKASACLTEAELKAYISQKLEGEELHRVECHLLDCELCSDAVEGLSTSTDVDRELQQNTYQPGLRHKQSKTEEPPDSSFNPPDNAYDLTSSRGLPGISYQL